MKKPVWAWVLAGLCVLGVVYMEGQRSTARAYARGVELKAEQAVKALEQEIGELRADNATLAGEAEKVRLERVRLEGELQGARVETAALRKKMAEAPPTVILVETRRILGTDEVELRPAGAEFSLAAFRVNADHLVEWERFSLVEIPNLEKQIAKAIDEKSIEAARADGNLVVADKERAIAAERQKTIEALKEYLAVAKGTGWKDKALWGGAGFLIGTLFGVVK